MNCPKCGHQNPDDIKSCESCGYNFSESEIQQPKAKTSKMAIFSFVLAISSLLFFVFTGLPAMLYGFVSLKKIRKSEGKLKGKSFAKAGLFLPIPLMCIFFLIWRMDAPPISNDYTITDLRSAPADCAESYELLKYLTEQFYEPENINGALDNLVSTIESKTEKKVHLEISEDFIEQPHDSNTTYIGLSWEERDIINKILYDIDQALLTNNHNEISKIIDSNAVIIQQLWEKTAKARDIIHQLNDFPEIADLYEPNFDANPINMIPLIDLCRLYQLYAHTQKELNDIHNFTTELIEIDSVFRKLSLNARLLITKLSCYIIISNNILTANNIANKTEASQESIELLIEHFKPLSKEQLSLKNPLIFEYLSMKLIVLETPIEPINRVITMFKKNSTLRLYSNKCVDKLFALGEMNIDENEKFHVWPDFLPFEEPAIPTGREKFAFFYRKYNPVGSLLL
jgi:hypothetical protein